MHELADIEEQYKEFGSLKKIIRTTGLKVIFLPYPVLIFTIGGDGRRGYEPGQPYDAIHVGAAAADLPQAVGEKST